MDSTSGEERKLASYLQKSFNNKILMDSTSIEETFCFVSSKELWD